MNVEERQFDVCNYRGKLHNLLNVCKMDPGWCI